MSATYRLHIPSWLLAWHLTFADLHASQALVIRRARGAARARPSVVSIREKDRAQSSETDAIESLKQLWATIRLSESRNQEGSRRATGQSLRYRDQLLHALARLVDGISCGSPTLRCASEFDEERAEPRSVAVGHVGLGCAARWEGKSLASEGLRKIRWSEKYVWIQLTFSRAVGILCRSLNPFEDDRPKYVGETQPGPLFYHISFTLIHILSHQSYRKLCRKLD